MSYSLTTITFLRYPDNERFWAIRQMAFARLSLKKIPGLDFWKLLGSGQGIGGFSVRPDWNKYALFCTWQTPGSAGEFFRKSCLFSSFRAHSEETLTISMLPVQFHGSWSGKTPFSQLTETPLNGPVAVLTRATISLSKLGRFWKHVPLASKSLVSAPGLLFSAGIGEAPLFRQATFSIWESISDMENYAYRSKSHLEIIKNTRAEKWYKEELFARFKIISSEGTINRINPLEGRLEGL